MERRMVANKPTWVGTMSQDGNGQAIQFLMAGEQFSTRSCVRCAGLLVNDWRCDLDNASEHDSTILRCVQCGYRIDPVILRNQTLPSVESKRSGVCTIGQTTDGSRY